MAHLLMRTHLWALALAFCLSFFGQAFAADNPAAPTPPAGSPAAVKLKLLGQLETDGYLSHKLADEARLKYVTPEDMVAPTAASATEAPAGPNFWDRVMTWTNVFYVMGVVVLLIAFAGWIAELAGLFMIIILAIPKELYQLVFLGAGAAMTANRFIPSLAILAENHSFYVALFGSVANLVVLAWVIGSHPKLETLVEKLAKLRVPLNTIASGVLMAYFGFLALGYHSEIFGFLAAVAFASALTFTIGYRPGVLWMDFEDKALSSMIFGNLTALILYTSLKLSGHLPPAAELFEVGLTYYCTIALGLGFLVGASPFKWRHIKSPVGYLALFILTVLGFLFAYVFYDFKVVGSILCVFAVLLALEWHAKLCNEAGFVGGMFLLGAALVGLSSVMERYGHLLVLSAAG